MNIIEAAKAMKEGKKIRQPHWDSDFFLYGNEYGIFRSDDKTVYNWFSPDLLLDETWVAIEVEVKYDKIP